MSQPGLSAGAAACYGSAMTDPSTSRTVPGTRHLFVRDLVMDASIGVYEHEHHKPQRIRVNLDLTVADTGPADDRIDSVVSYEPLVMMAREIVATGHVKLVETLAERLAQGCLADARVRSVRVRVEKLDVFPDAAAVGVEIERARD